ncbi:hypothetical protein EVAR_13407_1 [Eumeta japonica]|uniref:Uncharacterized protein n=1 Tax=Eumeta variegata TaxID=151549 RepID=A0A4C1V5Z9_EUMVA|nr:hypothetical protein EVAR_13407_1 [Eumeta japonica]
MTANPKYINIDNHHKNWTPNRKSQGGPRIVLRSGRLSLNAKSRVGRQWRACSFAGDAVNMNVDGPIFLEIVDLDTGRLQKLDS